MSETWQLRTTLTTTLVDNHYNSVSYRFSARTLRWHLEHVYMLSPSSISFTVTSSSDSCISSHKQQMPLTPPALCLRCASQLRYASSSPWLRCASQLRYASSSPWLRSTSQLCSCLFTEHHHYTKYDSRLTKWKTVIFLVSSLTRANALSTGHKLSELSVD